MPEHHLGELIVELAIRCAADVLTEVFLAGSEPVRSPQIDWVALSELERYQRRAEMLAEANGADGTANLSLSYRTWSAFFRAGVTRIPQAEAMSDAQLAKLRNIGATRIAELRTALYVARQRDRRASFPSVS